MGFDLVTVLMVSLIPLPFSFRRCAAARVIRLHVAALSNRQCNKPFLVLIDCVASKTPAELLSELAQSVDITLARKGLVAPCKVL